MTTTKVVKPGQAYSRGAKRVHQAKVEANAEKVAAMSGALPYLMTPATRGEARMLVHKAACPRGKGTPASALDVVAKGLPRVAATCCKPTLPSATPEPAAPKADGKDGIYEQYRNVESEPATVEAESDPVLRLQAAKAEYKALKEWAASGATPPRPATPNLDALNADHAAYGEQGRTNRRAEAAAARSQRSSRGATAIAEKKARQNKRGPGRKITADELAAYVRDVRAKHPEATMSDELEYAYWIEKLAVSRGSFAAAWEAAA